MPGRTYAGQGDGVCGRPSCNDSLVAFDYKCNLLRVSLFIVAGLGSHLRLCEMCSQFCIQGFQSRGAGGTNYPRKADDGERAHCRGEPGR